MPYIDLDFIKQRVDDATLKNLTKEKGGADAIDEVLVEKKVSDTESIINGFISKRYTTPIPDGSVPGLIKDICFDIVMYKLYRVHRTDTIDEAVKDDKDKAYKMLEKIEKGQINLNLNELSDSPVKLVSKVSKASSDRKFSKDFLSSYR